MIIPIDELEAHRVYWRCYSDLPRHKKLWRLSDNNARWAWIVLLCAASETNGVFESDQHIEAMIGTQNAKFIIQFRRVGLLDGLVVHDWDEWQEPDDGLKAAREAMALSARSRMARVTGEKEIPSRSMKEWLEYIVSSSNKQGRMVEFMGQMHGIVPQKNDYSRIAKLMREYPGGIPALMAAVCEAALRDLKGDPIAYLTAMSKNGNNKRVAISASVRDAHLEE